MAKRPHTNTEEQNPVPAVFDEHRFYTDAELADFLKKLSNKKSGIWLTIESDSDVPIEQLIKILTMVKTNPQGIRVKRIVLGK